MGIRKMSKVSPDAKPGTSSFLLCIAGGSILIGFNNRVRGRLVGSAEQGNINKRVQAHSILYCITGLPRGRTMSSPF